MIQRFALILLFLSCYHTNSQKENSSLTKEEKDTIIFNIGRFFENNYVFPQKGEEIKNGLKDKNIRKEFDSITDPKIFRRTLQSSIRNIVDDKHIILINRDPEENEPDNDSIIAEISDLELEFEDRKEMNFGIPEIRVLEKNIGYIKITKFTSPELFEPVIQSSSEFLKNVDALILDLRSRGGGRSETVSLLLSYFLPPNTHTFDWYNKDAKKVEMNWTLPFIVGHRFVDIPIAVLTSERTFSGSEAFCYIMKHHKRATVIGERTRGGAHTYKEMYPSDKYLILVPYERVVSAKTNENWEGKGVIPTIPTSAEEALETAKKWLINILVRRVKE